MGCFATRSLSLETTCMSPGELIRGANSSLIGRDLGAFTSSAPKQLGVTQALVNSVRNDQ